MLKCGMGIYPEFIDAMSPLSLGVHVDPLLCGNVAARGRITRQAQQI
jgi:hypothetical protein